MSLILAIKFSNGTVLAIDGHTTQLRGRLEAMESRAIPIKNDLIIGAAGQKGVIFDIVEYCLKSASNYTNPSFESYAGNLSDKCAVWQMEAECKFGRPRLRSADFIVASPDRIRSVHYTGYEEESEDFACAGIGRRYGIHLLSRNYRSELSVHNAEMLAVHVITETANIDYSVGKGARIFVLRKGCASEELSKEQVDNLKMEVAPQPLFK